MNHQTEPKSVKLSRIQENLKVFDFELSDEDIRRIADLKGCVGYASDSDCMNFKYVIHPADRVRSAVYSFTGGVAETAIRPPPTRFYRRRPVFTEKISQSRPMIPLRFTDFFHTLDEAPSY